MIYFLKKNGYYYGHNNCGYEVSAECAEIYSEKEAKRHADQCEEVHAIPVKDVLSLDRVEAVLCKLLAIKVFLEIEKLKNKKEEIENESRN